MAAMQNVPDEDIRLGVRIILPSQWLDSASKRELGIRTHQSQIETRVLTRRTSLGHTLKKSSNDIEADTSAHGTHKAR